MFICPFVDVSVLLMTITTFMRVIKSNFLSVIHFEMTYGQA